MTKNAMARVIVQALYRLDTLPPADHHEVVREAKATVPVVTYRHKLAVQILEETAMTTAVKR